jgi:HAD superfamily hydrolase (TIGR01509 family)
MEWIEQFDLFLFDFDGVLVDTESLHYASYREVCLRRGIAFSWDFEQYCERAHGETQGMQKALQRAFPELFENALDWDILYREKKQIYTELLKASPMMFMPGAERILKELHRRNKAHCVVTNSSRNDTETIRRSLPALDNIPHWITREDYQLAKPSPEGYLKAMALYNFPKERTIGFEDTLKGFKALSGAVSHPVLICLEHCSHIAECLSMGGRHFTSFENIRQCLKI